MRRAVLVALAALAALAPPAAAQDLLSGGERVVAQRTFTVAVRGELVLDFRSDPATCAAVGRCGLDGVVRYRPPRSGRLDVQRLARPGSARTVTLAGLDLAGGGSFGSPDEPAIRAQVRRATPDGTRVCTDAREGGLSFATEARGRLAPLGFGDPDAEPFVTRCAGPAPADVAPALTSRRVSTLAAPPAGRRVDLREERTFTAAGLTGTVRSSVVLTLRNARERGRSPDPSRRERLRTVTAHYRVERVRGQLAAKYRGVSDPARCALLDACGLEGELTYVPGRSGGTAELTALAPAGVPGSRLRAALGLQPGSARGVQGVGVFGDVGLRGLARTSARVALAGAPAPCIDAQDGPPAFVSIFGESGGALSAALTPGTGLFGDTALRTRCPGPSLASAGIFGSVTEASLPRSALRGRRVVLRFGEPRTRTDDGVRATISPALTVTLRRTRVVERVTTLGDLVPGIAFDVQTISR